MQSVLDRLLFEETIRQIHRGLGAGTEAKEELQLAHAQPGQALATSLIKSCIDDLTLFILQSADTILDGLGNEDAMDIH